MAATLTFTKIVDVLALITVLLSGLYLLGLALVAFFRREKSEKFLLGFVTSSLLHYVELSVRIVLGAGFILRAPSMPFSMIFTCFGWLLVITSFCLLALPWRWHQRFAQRTVPQALRYINLIAISSFVLGSFIVVCALFSAVS